jgi:GNAT superfamily N-acetyltransferase
MSKIVARADIGSLSHNETHSHRYPWPVIEIEPPNDEEIREIVERVRAHQHVVAQAYPAIAATFDEEALVHGLRGADNRVVVARQHGQVIGHLYGAIVPEDESVAAWVAPGGASFANVDALASLYVACADRWRSSGVLVHHAWAVPGNDIAAWLRLGFGLELQRGAMTINRFPAGGALPPYVLRAGTAADTGAAEALDRRQDDEATAGPLYLARRDERRRRADWSEALSDPETKYVLVECAGDAVAHGLAFPVPERLGSFSHSMHISGVYVAPDHRRAGLARAIVDRLLNDAAAKGFAHVETTWRVSDLAAERYWRNYGFTPTYVLLTRRIATAT